MIKYDTQVNSLVTPCRPTPQTNPNTITLNERPILCRFGIGSLWVSLLGVTEALAEQLYSVSQIKWYKRGKQILGMNE